LDITIIIINNIGFLFISYGVEYSISIYYYYWFYIVVDIQLVYYSIYYLVRMDNDERDKMERDIKNLRARQKREDKTAKRV
jgi:hypothetical protein